MSFLLIILFFGIVGVQLAFGVLFLKQPEKKNFIVPEKSLPEISIIICAKNESENLKRFLPAVLSQDYPEGLWEVLVVNDGSTDDSEQILEMFRQKSKVLRTIKPGESATLSLPGKKKALDTGIRTARFPILLLTDADCRPASDQWLKIMASCKAQSGKQIVLGYGAYQKQSGFLNQCIRWETVHTAMQYLSLARIGLPYMGVGRNLMYEKQLYFETQNNTAFRAHYSAVPSGDDDLLVAAMATSKNTALCIVRGAHTLSVPETTWKSWWLQKTRHAGSGKYYPLNVKLLLSLLAASHTLFWLLGLALIVAASCSGAIGLTVLLLFLFAWRMALYWISALSWQETLAERKLSFFYPAGDFLWAVYNVILSPYIFWKSRTVWK